LIRADDEALHCGWRAAQTVQPAVADVRAREPGVREVGAAEVAVAEDGSGEVGRIEVGIGKVAPLEDALLQARHAQKSEIELAILEKDVFELGFSEGGAGEAGCGDFDAVQRGASEIDVGQVGAFDSGVLQADARSCRIGEGYRAPDAAVETGCPRGLSSGGRMLFDAMASQAWPDASCSSKFSVSSSSSMRGAMRALVLGAMAQDYNLVRACSPGAVCACGLRASKLGSWMRME